MCQYSGAGTKGVRITGRRVQGISSLKIWQEEHNSSSIKTCGHCFSENRGTPFFRLTTPWEEVVRTLALLPEKGSIRGKEWQGPQVMTRMLSAIVLIWLEVNAKRSLNTI